MSKETKTYRGTAYIFCGIPGSGKSTWFEKQGFDPKRLAYVSMDQIREQVTGDTSDQTQNALVAKLAKDRYKQSLSLGVPTVVWDATNVARKRRKELIEWAKKAGYEVVCVYFKIPLEVAKERNKLRERVVPEHVLDRMDSQLQAPDRSEGIDRIITIKP